MMENKISVVINTYNAEKFLAEVLESVKGFDEILVCDMESTDRTREIATQYGCRIVTFPKANHVSAEPARTFAIESAKHPWVLVLDADELVTPELKDFLYRRITESDCPQGLWLPRKNYFMGRFMHSLYPDFVLRFFVRKGTVWPPYVHTNPTVQGRIERLPRKRKELALIHLANDSVEAIVRKTNLYTESEIEKKRKKNYGIAAMFYRPFFRFFKSYILKGGCRDGVPGFVHACLEAHYQFIALSKIFEERINPDHHIHRQK